jgi:NDP-sugar pyrophosphorylase family protein
MIVHSLIMAAGRGTRMMPLTNHTPKAMASYGTTSLIANSISKLKAVGLQTHITVGYKGAELAKHVIAHDVTSVFNTESKGNAWWIFNTLLKHLNEPVLVLTCDNIVSLDIDLIYSDYIALNSPPCLLIPVQPVDGLAGDFITHNNNIVTELNRTKPTECYCSGIQVINPSLINKLVSGTDDFNEVWAQLIAQQQLACSNIYPKQWYTVDTMEQLDFANKKLDQ